MTIQQLNSLTDDELAILWGCINRVHPPVIEGIDLNYKLFTAIKHKKLIERVLACKQHIKEEHIKIFDDMLSKINC